MNKYLTLGGLIVGMMIGSLMLDAPVTGWLIISIAVLLPLLAYWKAKQIHTHLPNEKNKTKTQWRKLAVSRVVWVTLLIGIGLLLEAIWWTQEKNLPFSMSVQKVGWQLGIHPTLDLVKIPAGTFMMGANDVNKGNEKPQHRVNINAFRMSRTEVTFAQYDYYIWQLKQRDKNNPDADYPDDQNWGRGNRPVINISWHQARGYAHWLSKQKKQECRLPSEAEWEYATRAGTKTAYYWGDTANHDYANYTGKEGKDQWDNTAPVGSFSPNTWGLHDMSGNVWEWVEDKWHDNYQGAPSDASAWLEGDTKRRVLRGGSWDGASYNVRSAIRDDNDPDSRNYSIGFRIVCVPIH